MVLPTHSGSIALQRSGEPFTPVERARARELAALAAARHRPLDADA
jgi:hypothetical protein